MTRAIKETQSFYWPRIGRAHDEVCDKVFSRVSTLYAHVPEVSSRLEWELDAIETGEFATIFYVAEQIATRAREEGYPVSTIGGAASSFVAYLLGITDINPLPPHYRCDKCKYSRFELFDSELDEVCPVCGAHLKEDGFDLLPEMLFGVDGDKVPDINLVVPREYHSSAVRHLQELFVYDQVVPIKVFSELTYPTAFYIVPREKCVSGISSEEIAKYHQSFDILCDVTEEKLAKLQSLCGVPMSEIPLDDALIVIRCIASPKPAMLTL